MIDYELEIRKYAKSNNIHTASGFTHVSIPDEIKDKVTMFTKNVILKKMSEAQYQLDGFNKHKRFYTGMLGEAGLEVLLNKPFMDWSIGYSREYAVPDLKTMGFNIGIKTVEYGKFPLVMKQPKDPEIINIKTKNDTIIILGLATVDVLREYSSDSLVLSPNVLRKGTKTGFFGFDKLIRFDNLEELQDIYTRI